jgi:hypothetical protein
MEPTLSFKKDKQVLAESIKNEISREFAGNLTIAIINSTTGGCLKIANSDADVFNSGAIVKNANGDAVSAGFDLNNLIIDPPGTNLAWIYYSEEFSINNKPDSGCLNPQILSVRKTNPLFLRKIVLGVANFSELKEKLKVPSTSDFAVSFEYGANTIYAGENKTSGNIYVKEIPVQYVDQSANVLPGKIKIRVY